MNVSDITTSSPWPNLENGVEDATPALAIVLGGATVLVLGMSLLLYLALKLVEQEENQEKKQSTQTPLQTWRRTIYRHLDLCDAECNPAKDLPRVPYPLSPVTPNNSLSSLAEAVRWEEVKVHVEKRKEVY